MVENISTDLSDEEAAQLYLNTQKETFFDVIYDRYASKIYAKCISLLKDEVRAIDATQEIFMKLLLKLSNFSGKSKLSTWIYAITYNHCIDIVRRDRRNPIYMDEDIQQYDREEEVSDAWILETQLQRLKEVLKVMSIDDRSILLMKYQDEMTIAEIGDILKKSESAIKMQIKRAKEKFRRKHEEMFSDN